ncbi:hydrogenase maturation protease [Streptomyces chattanoogensis]|uniref:hydrogenase maturation protease n=1 Tax=Streptomyces chattanoogensis TaxID=66876 RepID=UPI003682610D
MDVSPATPRIAVIGVGNDYRRDDGVGWAVVAGLAQRDVQRPLPHGTRLTLTDGEPTRLISAWEGTDLAILVDAARVRPARPGRIHRLRLHDDRWQSPHRETSSHGFTLGDAVQLARTLDRLPGALLVYAVEAADTSLGTGLSPHVSAAVEPVIARIEEDLAHHSPVGQ